MALLCEDIHLAKTQDDKVKWYSIQLIEVRVPMSVLGLDKILGLLYTYIRI